MFRIDLKIWTLRLILFLLWLGMFFFLIYYFVLFPDPDRRDKSFQEILDKPLNRAPVNVLYSFHELSGLARTRFSAFDLARLKKYPYWSPLRNPLFSQSSPGPVWLGLGEFGLGKRFLDLRNAFFAPTESGYQFSVSLADSCYLETEIASLAAEDTVTFSIAWRSSRGEERSLWQQKISPEKGIPRWRKIQVPLPSKEKGVLEFRTTAPQATQLAFWGNPCIFAHSNRQLKPNIVFILVDALRPDVAQNRRVAPNISKLFTESIVFENSFANSNWTRPSTLSFFSGKYPEQFRDPVDEFLVPEEIKNEFEEKNYTIPLWLRKNGYQTAAFTNNGFLIDFTGVGVDAGFEEMWDSQEQILDTQKITRNAVDWLQQNRNKPFFLYLNLNTPHGPYQPPPAYVTRIFDPADSTSWTRELLYRAEVHYADRYVGILLNALKQLALEENTWIVLTSDHGTFLRTDKRRPEKDHWVSAGFKHGNSMYQEELRVPLLMKPPGPHGEVRKDTVSLVDLFPTINGITGLEDPVDLPGKNILGKPLTDRIIFSRGRGGSMVLWRGYTYLNQWGDEELYNIVADPGQKLNLIDQSIPVLVPIKRAFYHLTRQPMLCFQIPALAEPLRIRVSPSVNVQEITGLPDSTRPEIQKFPDRIQIVSRDACLVKIILKNSFLPLQVDISGISADSIVDGKYSLPLKNNSIIFQNPDDFEDLLWSPDPAEPSPRLIYWTAFGSRETQTSAKQEDFQPGVRKLLEDWGYIQKK